jgi:hypothetical protein
MPRLHLAVTFLAVTGLMLTPASALANGPPIVNATDHLVDFTETFTDVDPCTGQPAEITVTQTGVIHFSFFADGTVHITGTLRGPFSVDLLPTDGTPDATGRFVVWFGSNGQIAEDGSAFGRAETTFVLNGKGTFADGSAFSFHQNGHAVFDASGDVKLEFFKAHCD